MQAVAPVRTQTTGKLLRRQVVAAVATLLSVTALGPVPAAQAGTPPALTTSVPAASIQQKCSRVKIRLVGINPDPQGGGNFFVLFVKAGAGWVASLGSKPCEGDPGGRTPRADRDGRRGDKGVVVLRP